MYLYPCREKGKFDLFSLALSFAVDGSLQLSTMDPSRIADCEQVLKEMEEYREQIRLFEEELQLLCEQRNDSVSAPTCRTYTPCFKPDRVTP